MELLILFIILTIIIALLLCVFGVPFEYGFYIGAFIVCAGIIWFFISFSKRWKNERKKKEEEEKEVERSLEEIRQERDELDRMAEGLKSEDLAWYISYKLNNKFSEDERSLILSEFESELTNDILCINCEFQTKGQIISLIEQVYEERGTKRPKSEWDSDRYYEDALYSVCLESIDYAFSLDDEEIIGRISFKGYVNDYSPATGQIVQTTIVSIVVSRERFEEIDIEHIVPKSCFMYLNGVSNVKMGLR